MRTAMFSVPTFRVREVAGAARRKVMLELSSSAPRANKLHVFVSHGIGTLFLVTGVRSGEKHSQHAVAHTRETLRCVH